MPRFVTPLLVSCSLFCLDAQCSPRDDAAAPASAAAPAVRAQFDLQPDLIEHHLGKGVTITGFTPQGFYDVNKAALNQRRMARLRRNMDVGRSEDNNWIHTLMVSFVKKSAEGYSWIENLPAGFNLRTAITDAAARKEFERTYEAPAGLTPQALTYQTHIDFAHWLQVKAATPVDADAAGEPDAGAVSATKGAETTSSVGPTLPPPLADILDNRQIQPSDRKVTFTEDDYTTSSTGVIESYSGLSEPENDVRWSNGDTVTIQFKAPLQGGYTLTLVAKASQENDDKPFEVKIGAKTQSFPLGRDLSEDR